MWLLGEQTWWNKAGHTVGEPVFIPDPKSEFEDEGVLLVVVLNVEACHSQLLVLDARTLTEVATADVPKIVPYGFHGNFYGTPRSDQ
jgi:carotenoid cleavage dioxygenase-like enzyme